VVGLGLPAWSILRFRSKIVVLASLPMIAAAGVAIWVFQGYQGLPVPVLIFGILGVLGILILQRTCMGRFVVAIGGNPEAAWLAGVPIRKIVFGIYVVMGALAGLSGSILSARLNGAFPAAGELFELDAIAAVVIGGTSLQGGVGTVRGSIFGAFFIGALNNAMSLLNYSEFNQKVIKGVIIILAV
jgi:ABC-type xylose transport system permease subunit